MTFYINQNSELPILHMQLIHDGRHDFNKFFEAIQNATITFTMVNAETGVYKVVNQECYIKQINTDSCQEQYDICYNWKKHDTNEKGIFEGRFNISFSEIKNDNYTYPSGLLSMPIRDELQIIVK
jgi:hypothetical protein